MIKIIPFTFLLFSQLLFAKADFADYVTALKQEALAKGFTQTFVDEAFEDVSYKPRAVSADKNQPESKLTLDTYLSSRVPQWKSDKAIALYQENEVLLRDIEQKFAVQARFIIALWGSESNFGKITGTYPVISSLTTMAYEGRREEMFKKQLFAALSILADGHVSKDNFKGSWAGAMGQTQFMPTSFLAYAYDYDGDGKKDIWNNKADALASIANYLKSEGWDNNHTWGRQVILPDSFDLSLVGLEKNKMLSLAEWQNLGVRRYDSQDLPNVSLQASLIMPDGKNGRIYLVYNNFHTLLKWNRSTYFGAAVSYLSDKIKKGS
jgi:membrane-bound lytic murein transglycosylase B